MADYERGYSFSGFQASAPATPLPATRLDNELDRVAIAIEAHRLRLVSVETALAGLTPEERAAFLAQIVQTGADTTALLVADINDAGATQITAVNAAGSTQVGLVNTAGSTQVGLVNTAGSTQVGLVEDAGDTQVAAIDAATDAAITAIGSAAPDEVTYSVITIGPTDVSVATTALTAGRAYGINTPAPFDGLIRKVHLYSLASRPVRIFAADKDGSGNVTLSENYVRVTTKGTGAETFDITEDLPIAAGQYPFAFYEVGAPYYVATASDGLLTVAGGMVNSVALASTSNTSLTLCIGFEIHGADRAVWAGGAVKAAEDAQLWTGKTWTAIGSSLTRPGYYASQAATRLGATLINFGASGQTLVGSPGVIYERGVRIDPRSELVTIELPINDFRLSKTLGSVRSTNTTDVLGQLYNLAVDLYEGNPFRQIALVLSPPNMDAAYAGKWNAANGNGVYWNEFADALEAQCKWLGIEFIRPKNMNGITSKWHTTDLVHPLEATGDVVFANSVAFGVSKIPASRVTQCETPVVAYDTGTNQATITCATSGASIYYTTDGSNPTTSSTLYSGAFTPSDGEIEIRAIAVKSGLGRSPQRRARLSKASTTPGTGTWNLRPAVVGDITSTRGVVNSLEGGLNWSVDVEPGPTNNTAIWLATGANTAMEFEVADAEEVQIAVGIGVSGWMAIGYFRLATVNSTFTYNLTTGAIGAGGAISPALTHSAAEPTRRFRVARSGTTVKIYENVYGTWATITSGLDLSTISGLTGYYETAQLGVVQDVARGHSPIKNVLVGTLT